MNPNCAACHGGSALIGIMISASESAAAESTLNRLTGLSAEASMLMTWVFENKIELKLLNGFHPFILVLLFTYPLSELICPLIFLAHFLWHSCFLHTVITVSSFMHILPAVLYTSLFPLFFPLSHLHTPLTLDAIYSPTPQESRWALKCVLSNPIGNNSSIYRCECTRRGFATAFLKGHLEVVSDTWGHKYNNNVNANEPLSELKDWKVQTCQTVFRPKGR